MRAESPPTPPLNPVDSLGGTRAKAVASVLSVGSGSTPREHELSGERNEEGAVHASDGRRAIRRAVVCPTAVCSATRTEISTEKGDGMVLEAGGSHRRLRRKASCTFGVWKP